MLSTAASAAMARAMCRPMALSASGSSPAAFSPVSLFTSGSQGVWLDPSDLTTMFSDRAGTTPVTTPGTVVGLRLDKSKGLTLGAELVVNGDFASGTTGWEAAGGTISEVSGRLRVSYLTANPFGRQGVTCVVGNTYLLTGQYFGGAETTRLYIGDSNNGANAQGIIDFSGDGTATVRFRATATTMWIIATGRGLKTGEFVEFDNISVRELAGNHATAPTDTARLTYGVEPTTGRRNLLLATDTLSTQSLTVTAVAHTLAFTGTGTVTLTGAFTAGPLVGTGAGNRVSLTFTPTAASLTLTVTGSVTLGQLQLGSVDTAYQRVTTAYDVTEAGVPTCHYVQYDGSDDSMSTAAIDFTATDKMSVFAGVRKLTNGNNACMVELSAVSSSTNGAFGLVTGRQASGTAPAYSFISRGNITTTGDTAELYNAPISNLLAFTTDIAGDLATLRVDGIQAAQSVSNQGTGNFGNYPIFFGRRNNTNLPFNGRDYGIIAVGKTASAAEITNTEAWLAANTSGVTL